MIYWLVVWDIWIIFPFSWECHDPNWRSPSFFRGVGLKHQAVYPTIGRPWALATPNSTGEKWNRETPRGQSRLGQFQGGFRPLEGPQLRWKKTVTLIPINWDITPNNPYKCGYVYTVYIYNDNIYNDIIYLMTIYIYIIIYIYWYKIYIYTYICMYIHLVSLPNMEASVRLFRLWTMFGMTMDHPATSSESLPFCGMFYVLVMSTSQSRLSKVGS